MVGEMSSLRSRGKKANVVSGPIVRSSFVGVGHDAPRVPIGRCTVHPHVVHRDDRRLARRRNASTRASSRGAPNQLLFYRPQTLCPPFDPVGGRVTEARTFPSFARPSYTAGERWCRFANFDVPPLLRIVRRCVGAQRGTSAGGFLDRAPFSRGEASHRREVSSPQSLRFLASIGKIHEYVRFLVSFLRWRTIRYIRGKATQKPRLGASGSSLRPLEFSVFEDAILGCLA